MLVDAAPGALLMLSCNLGDVCGSLLPLEWRLGSLLRPICISRAGLASVLQASVATAESRQGIGDKKNAVLLSHQDRLKT